MKKVIFGVSVLILLAGQIFAGTISGKVQCHMERANIRDALVILLKPGDDEFSKTVVSGATGNFFFPDVEDGKYNIEVVKDGFYKNVLFDLKVESDKSYTVTVKLLRKTKKDDSDYCFMLGGIEVCSEQKDLIPEEAVTSRKISSGEIEHMQATNLGDILSLVPGVEKSNNPGLSKSSQVGIRTIATSGGTVTGIESFGSSIIVDGNQMSNEANLTTKVYGSSGTEGIDLRNIPADNIKSVEVITGIPSVEYSNFANGIIIVETKSGQIAPKLKAKINPDTKTASFSHGIAIRKSVFDYHLNYAYSERDLRKEGDEYQRLHASGNLSKSFFNEKMDMKIRGSYTKMIDDEEPTDVEKIKDYNRGYRAAGSVNLDYSQSENDKITGFLGFDLNRKKAYKSKWVTEQLMIEGDSIPLPGYIGIMNEIGKEWNINGKLQKKTTYQSSKRTHKVLMGFEGDYQKNTGDGLYLDPVYAYYGQYSSRRSYSFTDFPEITSLSLYSEDEIKGKFLGKMYTLMLGLRYDVFNPTGFNFGNMFGDKAFFKSDHGDFLCPRFNMQYFITDDLRFRIGAGKSAKAVSLGYIYKPPAYYKYLKDSVVVEEEQLQYNPELQTYTTDKYEASIDWKIRDILGLSLTGYYTESEDRPTGVGYPWGYDINPDTITSASYAINENRGWNKSSGVEFTLRTKRIYNLQYKMNVTYCFTHSGRTGLNYDSQPDTSWEQIWYPPSDDWREKIIIDYQLNYISKRLGVWVTFDLQHVPLEHRKTIYNGNSKMKDVDGLEEQKLFYQGMTYWYDSAVYSSGGRTLFNFRFTKSLSQKTELSLYINNVLNDRGKWVNPFTGRIDEYNPEIYYGLEISTQW
ncbi:TonB-dependent receptor [bacterium]|nr:TonB-dependent receptor [bacterium]MBU1065979.1 TonB-dependent receptor [bacterium]MBU1633031.1 TonB-dependent receptor [bacterium]MBU1873085.1 TonB-dependent receptor [bacterium]